MIAFFAVLGIILILVATAEDRLSDKPLGMLLLLAVLAVIGTALRLALA